MKRKRELNIGMDFHGTVVDIQELKQQLWERYFDEWIPKFLLRRRLFPSNRLSLENYDRLMNVAMVRFSLFKQAPPMPDAIPTIKRWEQENHKLSIITSSGAGAFITAGKWCAQHGIFTSSNSMMYSVDRYHSKHQLARSLNLDVYIDNDLNKLIDINKEDPTLDLLVDPFKPAITLPEKPLPFLLTDEHNQHEDVSSFITRVDDWKEFASIVDALAS
jgi:hypothetical protein